MPESGFAWTELNTGIAIRGTPNRTDELECVRGVVSSLCYVAPLQAREVHTTSIKHALAKSGIQSGFRYGLAALHLIGEIQELPGGFWFPTPVRAVPLGGLSLVLAPTPSYRLQHEISGLRQAGIARVAPEETVADLNSQELNGWMGNPASDVSQWTLSELARLLCEMRPTLPDKRFEYFQIVMARNLGKQVSRFVWAEAPSNSIPVQDSTYLCREKLGYAGYRYALVNCKAGRVVAEAPIPYRPTRLQYGIALIEGKPMQLDGQRKGSDFVVNIPESIPRPEFRFLEAIATKIAQTFGQRKYSLSEELHPIFSSVFSNLGCRQGVIHV